MTTKSPSWKLNRHATTGASAELHFRRDFTAPAGHPFATKIEQARGVFDESDEAKAYVAILDRIAEQRATIAAAEAEVRQVEEWFAVGDAHAETVVECRSNLTLQRESLSLLIETHDRLRRSAQEQIDKCGRELGATLMAKLKEQEAAAVEKLESLITPVLGELDAIRRGQRLLVANSQMLGSLPAGPQTAVVANPRQLQSSLPPNSLPGTPCEPAATAELAHA
jgi:hypothetical protein